jgi:cytochrome b pre-mRNA-processing protein 3
VFRWKSESVVRGTARDIYGSIVAAARQTVFYEHWGVPDTAEGRFEMLALHVALVMRRLAAAGPAGKSLSRVLAETFVTDVDDNMREIGIGDLAVPRKVKRAAAALYDRHNDYGAALGKKDSGALAGIVAHAIGSASGSSRLDCEVLARYIASLDIALTDTPDADCLAGRMTLPR